MNKIYVVVEHNKKVVLVTSDDPVIENTIVINRPFGNQKKATIYAIRDKFETQAEFVTVVEYSVFVKAHQG